MSDTISLEGLDKAEVFAALYNGAKAQGLGFLHYKAEPMTTEKAHERFRGNFGYFDYVDGRVMKVDLSSNMLNSRLYDRDNGQGAAERIINALRATGDTNPEEAKASHREGTRDAVIFMKEHLHDELPLTKKEGLVTLTLGVGNFADELDPKLNEILGKDEEERP